MDSEIRDSGRGFRDSGGGFGISEWDSGFEGDSNKGIRLNLTVSMFRMFFSMFSETEEFNRSNAVNTKRGAPGKDGEGSGIICELLWLESYTLARVIAPFPN